MFNFIKKFFDTMLPKKKHAGLKQFILYLVAGGTATVADVTILFILTHLLHINYLIAAAVGFIAGVIINYSLNIALVFESTGKIKKEFSLFAIIGIGGLLWTELILWLLVDNLGLYVMIAKLIAIVLVLNWNFFMRKKFVFTR